jgi:hypothetical protein
VNGNHCRVDKPLDDDDDDDDDDAIREEVST